MNFRHMSHGAFVMTECKQAIKGRAIALLEISPHVDMLLPIEEQTMSRVMFGT